LSCGSAASTPVLRSKCIFCTYLAAAMANIGAIFDEALEKIFSNWTILALAVDQGWGGRDSRAKRQQLKDEVVARLTEGGRRKRPPSHQNEDDVNDLAEFLFQRVLQLFSCEADDGSDEEVASVCLKLFNTCREGDVSFAQQFLETCRGADLAKCHGVEQIQYATEEDQLIDGLQGMDIDMGDEHGDASEDDEEAMDQEADSASGKGKGPGTAMPAPSASMQGGYPTDNFPPEAPAAAPEVQRKEREEPTVDEDGFVSVVKGRRRPR